MQSPGSAPGKPLLLIFWDSSLLLGFHSSISAHRINLCWKTTYNMGDDWDYDDEGFMYEDPDYIYAEDSWDLAVSLPLWND